MHVVDNQWEVLGGCKRVIVKYSLCFYPLID